MKLSNSLVLVVAVSSAVLLLDIGVSGQAICANGCFRKIGLDNRQTCDCCHNSERQQDPCQGVRCASGQRCVSQEALCSNAFGLQCKLNVSAICVSPCQDQRCDANCQTVYDRNGCKQCLCGAGRTQNLCQGYGGCNSDQECVMEQDKRNDKPVASCRTKCPPVVRCPQGCLSYVNTVGCQSCHCCNYCLTTACGAREECVLREVGAMPHNEVYAECVAKTTSG